MPRKADEKLSPTMAKALLELHARTAHGEWLMAGGMLLRSNTLFALCERGLATYRLYHLHSGVTGSGYEGQITEKGKALVEQHLPF